MRLLELSGVSRAALAAVFVCVAGAVPAQPAGTFGRAASAEEVAAWNIDVKPDGAGLPRGRGTVAEGQTIYANSCAACHGATGVEGPKDRLVGGQGSLNTDKPIKTIGSYWPYATTVFDYIRRAMPYHAPGSMAPDEVYSVVAWLLFRNGIVAGNATVDQQSILKVQMPNRDGFLPQLNLITGEPRR